MRKMFSSLPFLRSKVQEYVDEFVYHFNHRFWEPQLLDRLLQAAVDHVPIRACLKSV